MKYRPLIPGFSDHCENIFVGTPGMRDDRLIVFDSYRKHFQEDIPLQVSILLEPVIQSDLPDGNTTGDM